MFSRLPSAAGSLSVHPRSISVIAVGGATTLPHRKTFPIRQVWTADITPTKTKDPPPTQPSYSNHSVSYPTQQSAGPHPQSLPNSKHGDSSTAFKRSDIESPTPPPSPFHTKRLPACAQSLSAHGYDCDKYTSRLRQSPVPKSSVKRSAKTAGAPISPKRVADLKPCLSLTHAVFRRGFLPRTPSFQAPFQIGWVFDSYLGEDNRSTLASLLAGKPLSANSPKPLGSRIRSCARSVPKKVRDAAIQKRTSATRPFQGLSADLSVTNPCHRPNPPNTGPALGTGQEAATPGCSPGLRRRYRHVGRRQSRPSFTSRPTPRMGLQGPGPMLAAPRYASSARHRAISGYSTPIPTPHVQHARPWRAGGKLCRRKCAPHRHPGGTPTSLDILSSKKENVAFSAIGDKTGSHPILPRNQTRHTFHDIFS